MTRWQESPHRPRGGCSIARTGSGTSRPSRRVAAGLSIVAGLALAATACSSPNSDTSSGGGGGKTLHVSLEAVGTTAQQDVWQRYVAKQFKATTGDSVQFTTLNTGDQVLNTIETGATTQTGPDVLDTADSYNGSAEAAKIYDPITAADWKLMGGKDKFTPSTLSQSLTGGNTITWYLHVDLLAYNKYLFKKAGIKSPPATWDEYTKDASLISKLGTGMSGAPFDPVSPYDPWHSIWTLTRDYGGNFVNAAGTKATMTSVPVQKAFEYFFNLYQQHVMVPQSINWSSNQLEAAFANRKVGMLNQTSSVILSDVAGSPAAHDVAFAPMPTIPPGATSMPAGAPPHGVVGFDFGYTWGVPKWSHNASLGYKFINIATSPAAEKLLYKETAALPSTVKEAAALDKDPAIGPFLKYEPESIVAPSVSYWGTVENTVATVSATLARDVQNHSYNKSALMAALQKANQQIDGAIANSGKS